MSWKNFSLVWSGLIFFVVQLKKPVSAIFWHSDLFIQLDSSWKALSHATNKDNKKILFEKIKYCFYMFKVFYREGKQFVTIKGIKAVFWTLLSSSVVRYCKRSRYTILLTSVNKANRLIKEFYFKTNFPEGTTFRDRSPIL